MKKLLFLFFAIIALSVPCVAQQLTFVEQGAMVRRDQSKVAGAICRVTYRMVCDPEKNERPALNQYMITSDGAELFIGQITEDGTAVFECPAGNYDLFCMFSTNRRGPAIVVRDNVRIDGDHEFTFDINEATNQICFAPLMPDGSEMTLGTWDRTKGEWLTHGNIKMLYANLRICHKIAGLVYTFMLGNDANFLLPNGDVLNGMRVGDVWTNQTDKFEFGYLAEVYSIDGYPMVVSISADGIQGDTYHNDPSAYRDTNPRFAGAEFVPGDDQLLYNATYISALNLFPGKKYGYAYSFSFFGEEMAHPTHYYTSFSTLGREKPELFESTLCAVLPMAHDEMYKIMGIYSPNLSLEDGMVENHVSQIVNSQADVYGLNNADYIFYSPGDKPFVEFNPIFSFTVGDGDFIYGNSCPLWIPGIKFDGSTLSYLFIGRGGEARSIDLFNHELDLKIGGETIIDSYSLLAGWDNPNGSFGIGTGKTPVDIAVRNRNLKIDDTWLIDGCATLHLDRSGEKVMTPTVQMLQLRNGYGQVTDRFAEAEDIDVLIAAAAFENVSYINFVASRLEGLKVEVAPNGSEEFVELSAEIDEEVGLMPTYGWLYRARLDREVAKSANGWYDLRLTATDATGSYMTQVVSPAFSIGESSVGSVERDVDQQPVFAAGGCIVAPDGARVYTLGGIETGRDNLAPGLYIVVTGNRAVKVAVR